MNISLHKPSPWAKQLNHFPAHVLNQLLGITLKIIHLLIILIDSPDTSEQIESVCLSQNSSLGVIDSLDMSEQAESVCLTHFVWK